MSVRQLSNPEVSQVLLDHPDMREDVGRFEMMFNDPGATQTWDQILAAEDPAYAGALPIPPYGKNYDDAYYGKVTVFPDAHGLLHYIVTDNQSLLTEIDRPVYASSPDYWNLFGDIAKSYGEQVSSAWEKTTSTLQKIGAPLQEAERSINLVLIAGIVVGGLLLFKK